LGSVGGRDHIRWVARHIEVAQFWSTANMK
jgi:hypothetical protein